MLIVNSGNDPRVPRTSPLGIWGSFDENAAYLVLTLPGLDPSRTPLASVWDRVETQGHRDLRKALTQHGSGLNNRVERSRCNAQTGGVSPLVWAQGHAFWSIRRTRSPSGGLTDPAWFAACRASWTSSKFYAQKEDADVPRPSSPEEGWTSVVATAWETLARQGEALMSSTGQRWGQEAAWKSWLREALLHRSMLSMMGAVGWSFSPKTADRLVETNDRLLLSLAAHKHTLTTALSSAPLNLWGPGLAPGPAEEVMLDRSRLWAVVADRVDPITGVSIRSSARPPRKL